MDWIQRAWIIVVLFNFLSVLSKLNFIKNQAPPFSEPISNGQEEMNTTLLLAGDFSAKAGQEQLQGIAFWNSLNGWSHFKDTPQTIGDINDMVNSDTYLYFGGKFRSVGDVQSSSIISYNPKTEEWASVCGGVLGVVSWTETYGHRLYIGGDFDQVIECDGTPRAANNVAMYSSDTKTWTTFGPGVPSAKIVSLALRYDSQDTEPILYIAGEYYPTPQSPATAFVQRLTNGTFVDITHTQTDEQNIYSVVSVDQNTNKLYLGGSFRTINHGEILNSIAVYENNEWKPLGLGIENVYQEAVFAITFFQDMLIVGGHIHQAGDIVTNNIAGFNLTTEKWVAFGDPESPGVQRNNDHSDQCLINAATVWDMTVYQDALLINGIFDFAGNESVNNVAFYNFTDNRFSKIGDDSNLNNTVLLANGIIGDELWVAGQAQKTDAFNTYEVHSTVVLQYNYQTNTWEHLTSSPILGVGKFQSVALNGTTLYAAGSFAYVGGRALYNVAYLENGKWWSLSQGLENNGHVYTIALDGDDLWIGGFFNSSSKDGYMIGLARWNRPTKTWIDIDGGLMTDSTCVYNSSVQAIHVTEDSVYIGGSFPGVGQSNPVESPNIARWDKATQKWFSVAKGIPTTPFVSYFVHAIDSFNGQVYAAGSFSLQPAGSKTNIYNIARYLPEQDKWDPLYTGVELATTTSGENDGWINVIKVVSEDLTIIGGHFYLAGGNIVHNIARTMDDNWQSYGGGLTSSDNLAEVHDIVMDNETGDIYACGSFTEADGSLLLNNIAEWSNSGESWTRVAATDLSRPEGNIYRILLMENEINPPNTDNSYASYEVAAIAVGIVLFIISVIFLVAFLIWKIRNRNPYQGYKPIASPVSLTELEQDKDIKRIDINKLEMGERIAIGASGEVIKGNYLGTAVAIKRTLFQHSDKQSHDFLREIKIMSLLRHKNIVDFVGAATTSSNQILLAMEFLANGSLKDHIHSSKEIEFNLKIRLCTDAARGMNYLHNWDPKIIHRDLKSSNLLISKIWTCKIGDFGISRFNNTISNTTLVGTPAYMAPEVILQNQFTTTADIYSFGIVLTEMISWREPFSDLNLSFQQVMFGVVQNNLRPTIPSDCPQELSLLIKDCLNSQADLRPDFKEVKQRLKRLL